MLLVLSWRRRLRTYESANLEACQPIRNRSAKHNGFGLSALAEVWVTLGSLSYQEALWSERRDYQVSELRIHTVTVVMTLTGNSDPMTQWVVSEYTITRFV